MDAATTQLVDKNITDVVSLALSWDIEDDMALMVDRLIED